MTRKIDEDKYKDNDNDIDKNILRTHPKSNPRDSYLILVSNASNGVSVKFSMWEEFFLNEREKDSCVILYTVTVCYFTHSVQFYMQCEIVHTVCNFMYSV